MKIKIRKIETYSITQTTPDYIFEMDEFRNCTPAFIGSTHKEFMDYITNDIEEINKFIDENEDIICQTTKKSLYLLDVKPNYEVEEDSREDYEDSWFVMKKVKEGKDEMIIDSSSTDTNK